METEKFAIAVFDKIVSWTTITRASEVAEAMRDPESFGSRVELVAEAAVLGRCPRIALEDEPLDVEAFVMEYAPAAVELDRVPGIVAALLRGN